MEKLDKREKRIVQSEHAKGERCSRRPGLLSLVALLALATLPTANRAAAQPALPFDNTAALLVLPILADDEYTFASVTNVSTSGWTLRLYLLDDAWTSHSFSCDVTAAETTLFTFAPAAPGLNFSYECGGVDLTQFVAMTRGVFVVALENALGETTNQSAIVGHGTVVDFGQGWSYSIDAIPFRGLNPMAPGIADKDYVFDNNEYSMFPATLSTPFIAPTSGGISADLVLFTLDGRMSVAPGPVAQLDILFYDDEETPTSAYYTFDCFAVVPLQDINPNFLRMLLGSDVGYLYMTPLDGLVSDLAHDVLFGNGNGVRVTGVHGWLVQVLPDGADMVEGGNTIIGYGAWGRRLDNGMLPQDLDGTDIPTLRGL